MPKMLTGNGQKGWPHIQRLLVDLFQFMEPFLRNAELGDPVCIFILLLNVIVPNTELELGFRLIYVFFPLSINVGPVSV